MNTESRLSLNNHDAYKNKHILSIANHVLLQQRITTTYENINTQEFHEQILMCLLTEVQDHLRKTVFVFQQPCLWPKTLVFK